MIKILLNTAVHVKNATFFGTLLHQFYIMKEVDSIHTLHKC
jgi:hypothetical protein